MLYVMCLCDSVGYCFEFVVLQGVPECRTKGFFSKDYLDICIRLIIMSVCCISVLCVWMCDMCLCCVCGCLCVVYLCCVCDMCPGTQEEEDSAQQ